MNVFYLNTLIVFDDSFYYDILMRNFELHHDVKMRLDVNVINQLNELNDNIDIQSI